MLIEKDRDFKMMKPGDSFMALKNLGCQGSMGWFLFLEFEKDDYGSGAFVDLRLYEWTC